MSAGAVRRAVVVVVALLACVLPEGIDRAAATPDPPAITAIAAGATHTCAIVAGGVRCWGSNADGELGDGTNTGRLTPVPVLGLGSGVTAIAAGDRFSCALTSGAVKCWGANGYGELGDGTNTPSNVPVDVSGLSSGVVALSSVHGSHACAATASGAVCWGRNDAGQLGDGTTEDRPAPVAAAGVAGGAIALAAGGRHTCVVSAGGGVSCWGFGENGELGNGTTTSSLVPVAANGLASGVVAIAAGHDHTCAVTDAQVTPGFERAKCWGDNSHGEIGIWVVGAYVNAPAQVVGLTSGVTAIAAGENVSCAVASGSVKCWGVNANHQVGDGTTSVRPYPVTTIASGATAVVANGSGCALVADGGARCWGPNGSGQLGDGTTTEAATPVAVVFAAGATNLAFMSSPGDAHTFAAFATQPAVAVRDANGTTVTSDGATVVTLSLENARGAVLTCAGGLSRTVAQGVATFAGCRVDLANTGYALRATANPALTAATSAPFAVAAGPPAPATNVTATPIAGPGAHLSWDDGSAGATVAFAVYRWKWGEGNPVVVAGVVPASQLAFDDVGLEPSTLYFYWVVASNLAGGTWSTAAQVTTPGGPPNAPANLAAVATGRTSVSVTWNDASANELGFILFRSDGGAWEVVEWLPAGTTAYADSGRNPASFYFYWVWSWGWNGFSVAPSIVLALTYP
ncbi:MAG: RCC1 repeat-containing protein [Dehalococcoidia bacterium]|nr:RCC1 repeat-containing protein [Dehalococcoidia bacterium]